jgi:hypothetical protein
VLSWGVGPICSITRFGRQADSAFERRGK